MEEIAAPLVTAILDVARGRGDRGRRFSFGGNWPSRWHVSSQRGIRAAGIVIVDSDAPEPALARRLRERTRSAVRAPLRLWRSRRRPIGDSAPFRSPALEAALGAHKWAKRNYRPPQDYHDDIVLLASAETIKSSGDSTFVVAALCEREGRAAQHRWGP